MLEIIMFIYEANVFIAIKKKKKILYILKIFVLFVTT